MRVPPQYAPLPVTFNLLTSKVVSESRVTWATSMPILVFLGLSVLDIGVGTGGPGGGPGPPDFFLFEGAQYARGPLTFEKCRPIFELKVTPYFQS